MEKRQTDDARVIDGRAVVLGDQQAEGGVVGGFVQERPQAQRVADRVDAAPILDLHRYAPRAGGQHEVDLPVRAPFGQMGDVEAGYGGGGRTEDALRHVAGQGAEFRTGRQLARRQRYRFLQPGGAQAVIGQAELGAAPLPLEADLQRRNEPQQQGVGQEAQVMRHPLAADVGGQRQASLFRERRRRRRLSGVAAGQPEYLLQQRRVASPAAVAVPQVVLNDPPDHRFVQLVGQQGPVGMRLLVDQRIAAPLRKVAERFISDRGVGASVRAQSPPEVRLDQVAQAVVRQKRRRRRQPP